MEWLPSATSIIISIIAGGLAGFSIARTRYLRRILDEVSDGLEVASELLEALERAQDPGREVHERLAAAYEPAIIATDRKLEPAQRRAIAMDWAGRTIETIRHANLELVVKEDDE